MNGKRLLGKAAYGFLFIAVIPLLLIEWARRTAWAVPPPLPGSFAWGLAAAVTGAAVMLLGMATLMLYGGGLPMNAYPPPKFVRRGIYRVMAHPIYCGFSLLCVGVAMAARSASGLWLVSPVVMLACVALVEGHERHDLAARFGPSLPKPLLALPANEERRPTIGERLSVYLLVLLPWLALYEAVATLGVPRDAMTGYLPFETYLPVWEWMEIFYAATYLFVLAVPACIRSARTLREFAFRGFVATGLITLLFLTIPIIAPPRPFVPSSALGELLIFERAIDTPAAAFPSFHVVWAMLAASAFAASFPRLRAAWWALAAMVAVSSIMTGMHSVADVAAALPVGWLVLNVDRVWERLRRSAERTANSWREWRIGPLRIINHGLYAAAGTFAGVAMFGILLGPAALFPVLIVAVSGLVTAGLWAQFIEGSPKLLRPFGYYGGVIGSIIGALVAQFLGTNIYLLLGAFSVAAPWIQAAGRIRCLVQGCCHGRAAPDAVGIRYTHRQSRVCRLAGLAGVPIHPTPLYSILWNVACGLLLARLWSLRVPPNLVAGLYLMLNGLGRFVEESYRGEPQTPVFGKLRLYQFMSILSLAGGALLTSIQTQGLVIPAPHFSWLIIGAALGFGLLTWFALGVDFPDSNRRFARLV